MLTIGFPCREYTTFERIIRISLTFNYNLYNEISMQIKRFYSKYPNILFEKKSRYLFKDNKSATMKLLPPTKMKSFSVASLWAAFSAVATSG